MVERRPFNILSALTWAALPFLVLFECFFGAETGEDCGDFDSFMGIYEEYLRLSHAISITKRILD